jgi:monovalent cation:H+ antiporter-2, CPA2 family
MKADMEALPTFIQDLTIVLSAAGLSTLICQKIKQPSVLGYLIAGFLIGPYTPYAWISDLNHVKMISQLGVIFLIFSMGLELNFRKLTRIGLPAGIIGIFEVMLMLVVGFFAGQLMGWSFYPSLFLGAALSISSTTIIIKTIKEFDWMKKRFAEVIFGVLVVEDVLAILLLVTLSTLAKTSHFFSIELGYATIKLILVITGWFTAGYFLVPTFMRKIAAFANEEGVVLTVVSLCLFFSFAAVYLDYSAALGAFIIGSILAESHNIKQIDRLINPIKDVFAAVFFVSVGMMIQPSVLVASWPMVLFIILLTIVGKLLITTVGALLSGQSLSNALRIGMGMAQVGEFSFIIAGLGQSLGLTSPKLYSVIVAASGITTFTTPYLMRLSMFVTQANGASNHNNLWGGYFKKIFGVFHPMEREHFKKTISRLFINGALVAIIFMAAYHLLFPMLLKIVPTQPMDQMLVWLTALLFASPFLWGMMFSNRIPLFSSKKISLKLSKLISWSLTAGELFFLSFIYFQKRLLLMLFGVAFSIVFSSAYRFLEKAYQRLEKHLVSNIKSRELNANSHKELAAWSSSLSEVELAQDTYFAGRTLKDIRLRQRFHINIVAIYREQGTVIAPNGKEVLLAHDKLIVLGKKEDIECFQKLAELTSEKLDLSSKSFSFEEICLEKRHPWVGKSISESNMRKKYGLVVGVERNGKQILNPDSDFILQENDALLLARQDV